jgi:hypothetical protein
MPTAFNVRALTSTVQIELEDTLDPDEQKAITSQWADLMVEPDAVPVQTIRGGIGQPVDETRRGNVTPLLALSADELADRIASAVTLVGIGDLSGEALMLHAAAVSLDDGRVVGFIGPSGRGKTTAARALGESFGYVTDETLAVRVDGSVVPYPKPLSIGERPSYKRPTSASSLGLGLAPADGLHLAALVLLDRQPDVRQPRVESISLTEALPDLVPQTSYFSQIERPLRALVQLVQSTGGVRRVVYSDASTLPALIDEIIATTYDDDSVVTDVASDSLRDCDCYGGLLPDASVATDSPAEVIPGTYRRAQHTDALLIDDQLLVLRPHEVTVLEGVGPVVWLAANDSTDDDLHQAAMRELPEPPEGVDPSHVIAAAIQQLVDAQLLARR